MDFSHALGAREEALGNQLDDQQVRWLADACQRQRGCLHTGSVRGHTVEYDPMKWPELTEGIGHGNSITRGDIFDNADAAALDVFTASYVFGMGKTGYGRSRYDEICASASDLDDVLEHVREVGRCQGPVIAYAQLYGGHDYAHRTQPRTPPWSRIAGFGPAFFTKFLYFSVPGALILDARLAHRVAHLIGNEYGYLKNGRHVAWTPYRYAVYLHWMTQTATAVSQHAAPHTFSPAFLELTLFELTLADLPRPTGSSALVIDCAIPDDREGDEGDAAD